MSEKQLLRQGQILRGSLFDEPMRVETARDHGNGTWVVGLVGTQSEKFRRVTLTAQDLAQLTVLDTGFRYDGNGRLLRLGLQAYSLGIAWEFDPYFGLSGCLGPKPNGMRVAERATHANLFWRVWDFSRRKAT